jgi:signal transduction histidine kinase
MGIYVARTTVPTARRSSDLTIATLRWLRVALAAAVVVPVLLFAGAAWFDHNQLLDRETADAQSTVGILREHILKVIDTDEQLIREVDRRIQGMAWDEIRARRAKLATELNIMIADLPQVSTIGISDGSGIEWVASTLDGTSLPPMGWDISQREYWSGQRDADQIAFISRVYTGIQSHHQTFAISRRRISKDGAFDGTIHVAVAVSYFVEFWERALHGHPGTGITLARTDGEILAHSSNAQTSARYLTLRGNPPVASEAEGGVFSTVSSIDGVKSIYASATIGRYPLVVIYRRSVTSALVTWDQRLVVTGGICALAAAALASAILLVMHQARRLGEEQARRIVAEQTAIEGQRLEILGQLAAGVAHDFANVVHAVEVGASMIEDKATDEPTRRVALWIGEAAKQGRWLTRRMLDFARDSESGEDGADHVVHPIEAVSGMARLLSSTLGAGYFVRYVEVPDGLPVVVRGDRGGLEGAIMNLAVNARDAMPDGGQVVIGLAAERVLRDGGGDPNATSVPAGVLVAGLAPGLYARISVADAGEGMAPDVLARASEPFFTTRPRGRGTGLGLAGARGFAHGAGGGFHIESAQGVGTTVTLWLPEADEPSR